MLSERLNWAIDEKAKREGGKRASWASIAAAAETSRAAVTHWKDDKNGIDAIRARRLAKFLGVDAEWLETGAGEPVASSGSSFNMQLEEANIRSGRPVPIVGTVQGGDDGFLEELGYPAGHGEGTEMYYGRDPNTYCVRVRGDSMAERIMSGDRLVVEPNTAPQGGDIAVVILKDGRKTVKRMKYIRDDVLHLEPFNREHREMEIPLEQVEGMHKVVQIIPI